MAATPKTRKPKSLTHRSVSLSIPAVNDALTFADLRSQFMEKSIALAKACPLSEVEPYYLREESLACIIAVALNQAVHSEAHDIEILNAQIKKDQETA